jgi:hypothetical protein
LACFGRLNEGFAGQECRRVGNASLLNATIDDIGMVSSCIAMRRVKDARAIERA